MNTEQSTISKQIIKTEDLQPSYHIFGNKGNVWSDECHIHNAPLSGRTMCGTPMLSSNWARIEGMKTIGCQKCIEAYLAATKK